MVALSLGNLHPFTPLTICILVNSLQGTARLLEMQQSTEAALGLEEGGKALK